MNNHRSSLTETIKQTLTPEERYEAAVGRLRETERELAASAPERCVAVQAAYAKLKLTFDIDIDALIDNGITPILDSCRTLLDFWTYLETQPGLTAATSDQLQAVEDMRAVMPNLPNLKIINVENFDDIPHEVNVILNLGESQNWRGRFLADFGLVLIGKNARSDNRTLIHEYCHARVTRERISRIVGRLSNPSWAVLSEGLTEWYQKIIFRRLTNKYPERYCMQSAIFTDVMNAIQVVGEDGRQVDVHEFTYQVAVDIGVDLMSVFERRFMGLFRYQSGENYFLRLLETEDPKLTMQDQDKFASGLEFLENIIGKFPPPTAILPRAVENLLARHLNPRGTDNPEVLKNEAELIRTFLQLTAMLDRTTQSQLLRVMDDNQWNGMVVQGISTSIKIDEMTTILDEKRDKEDRKADHLRLLTDYIMYNPIINLNQRQRDSLVASCASQLEDYYEYSVD